MKRRDMLKAIVGVPAAAAGVGLIVYESGKAGSGMKEHLESDTITHLRVNWGEDVAELVRKLKAEGYDIADNVKVDAEGDKFDSIEEYEAALFRVYDDDGMDDLINMIESGEGNHG